MSLGDRAQCGKILRLIATKEYIQDYQANYFA